MRSAHEALLNTFNMYGSELTRVEESKHLGRPHSFLNLDVPALCRNFKRAHKMWQKICQVLQVENIPAPICDMS